MSTVIIHADVQAHSVAEDTVDVVNRNEVTTLLSDFALAAPATSITTSTHQASGTENTLLVKTASTITLPLASQYPK